jgi:hypothetical protein
MLLGLGYKNGIGVEKDTAKALANFSRGCELSHGLSCMSLAGVYRIAGEMQNLETANAFSKKSCDLGIISECLVLGEAIYFGQGSPQNYEQSIELFRQSCAHNIAAGCYYEGLANLNGQGITKNEHEAKRLFEKAVFFDRNFEPAKTELDLMNRQN